jgi:Rhodopirellula transposase DDE domain
MPRLVECVQPDRVTLRLADSPPSHRKDNPIERCWGLLEQHGRGPLLDAIDPGLPFARTMPWNGRHPVVDLVTTTSQTGVTVTRDAMATVEAQRQRLPDLGTWFVDILSPLQAVRDA